MRLKSHLYGGCDGKYEVTAACSVREQLQSPTGPWAGAVLLSQPSSAPVARSDIGIFLLSSDSHPRIAAEEQPAEFQLHDKLWLRLLWFVSGTQCVVLVHGNTAGNSWSLCKRKLSFFITARGSCYTPEHPKIQKRGKVPSHINDDIVHPEFVHCCLFFPGKLEVFTRLHRGLAKCLPPCFKMHKQGWEAALNSSRTARECNKSALYK